MNCHPNFFILHVGLVFDIYQNNHRQFLIGSMQFTLSTIFLIFFMVAASLALFAPDAYWFYAIWFDVLILCAAYGLYRGKNGFTIALYVFFFVIPVTDLLSMRISIDRMLPRTAICTNNLKNIGLALQNYHNAYGHFPPANICDKNGKVLLSWRVAILPMLDNDRLYNALNKDEPWNSPHNIKVLSQFPMPEFQCPSAARYVNDYSTNYMAVIGPGTAWREDGPVKFSDLPDNGSHTVMLVEVVNSGVHWAEPRDLTVDEALEGLKTGKGLRISTAHPYSVNILFADGAVQSFPSKMPISLWKKILAGEVKELDNIEDKIDPYAEDMVNVSTYAEPSKWPIILGAIVWLFSIVLLFRRAIKSRRKAVVVEVQPEGH